MKNNGNENNESYNRIRPLMAYFKKFGTIKNIKQNETFEYNGENIKVGWIVSNLRKDKKKGVLSKDMIELLDYMEMNWDVHNVFEDKKKILLAWYLEYKTLSNLTQYSTFEYNGNVVNIGHILSYLRVEKKNGVLTDAQVEFLNMCGIVWSPRVLELTYASLVAYYNQFGTIANLKTNEVFVIGDKKYNVGRQIYHLRMKYKKGLLSDDEIEFFEKMGMVWGPTKKNSEDEQPFSKEDAGMQK